MTSLPRDDVPEGHWRERTTAQGLVIEAWGQGFFVGALVIMAALTMAAMRRRVLLHKLILMEQLLALPHGVFCFMSFSGYGWYVSWTATLLFGSYILHNFVAWLKIAPFFIGKTPCFFTYRTGETVRWVYLSTLAATVPIWIFNAYINFKWNISNSSLYHRVRPYECLVRDPWWIFTNGVLFHVVTKTYGVSICQLVRKSPRLGILLLAIVFAVGFTVVDVVATVLEGRLGNVDGINPFWKLSLVFKCLTDAIMLDDFATELRRIGGANVFNSPVADKELRPHDTDPNHDPSRATTNQALHSHQGAGRVAHKSHSSTELQNYLEIEDIGRLAE